MLAKIASYEQTIIEEFLSQARQGREQRHFNGVGFLKRTGEVLLDNTTVLQSDLWPFRGENDKMQQGTEEEPSTDEHAIKTMKLYNHVERVYNELREAGARVEGSGENVLLENVTQDMLLNLPGMYLNYGQRDSVQLALDTLGLEEENGKGKLVIDVGSGLGHPARTMAWLSPGLQVLGVELQPDQAHVGNLLSSAAGLDGDYCNVVAANFLEDELVTPPGSADGLVSWLCILHMGAQGRQKMWSRGAEILKPGAKLYVEDFFRRGDDFTKEELRILQDDVYCDGNELPSREEYIAELEAAGFSDVQFEDLTETWTKFCDDRFAIWKQGKSRIERVHNEATFRDLSHFYDAIVRLWHGGNLGGVRVVATKLP